MMIMAQHPQKQSQEESGGSANPIANHRDTSTKHSVQLREKANRLVAELLAPQNIRKSTTMTSDDKTIRVSNRCNEQSDCVKLHPCSNDNEVKQQRHHDQDSKRTLIKNQLYLIEQLQLENANLRNERDQLQLENEELKFQLQIISSSNILGQSGNAFDDDRQIDKLTRSDDKGAFYATANGCTTAAPGLLQQQQRQRQLRVNDRTSVGLQPQSPNYAASMLNPSDGYRDLAVTTSTSDLSRQKAVPLRYSAESDNTFGRKLDGQDKSEMQHIIRQSTSCSDCRKMNSDSCDTLASKFSNTIISVRSNHRPSGIRSTPFSAVTVKGNIVPSLITKTCSSQELITNQDDQEDDLIKKRILQQFPDSGDRVYTAAIVIQRAFRKYQICKRFRVITEQLRQASRQSPTNQQKQRQTSTCSVILDQSRTLNSINDASAQVVIPYASGVTRAAAWESLSQAASRLAATAATLGTVAKPNLIGVSKSTSCQHVSPSNNRQHKSKSPLTSQFLIYERSPEISRENSVMAAAINFQQLESIRKRQYRVGLNIFNKNPEKGVSYLIAHSFIDCTPSYSKTSNSYYLSNQLHFMDKQQLTVQQQSITSASDNLSKVQSEQKYLNCRMCYDEENLKRNIAYFLLHRKGLAKEKIGQYLGNLQSDFNQSVLHYYLQSLDFNGLQVDLALRKFSSTMRMPGEAQKIERFVDCFAQRYVQCQQFHCASEFNSNPGLNLASNNYIPKLESDWTEGTCKQNSHVVNIKSNQTLLSKDEIFILTFAIIMLNTDLHSPSLKSSSRMSANQFVNNLRGVFKSQTINESDLIDIYERVKANQITTSPDHVVHVMKVQQGLTTNNFQKKELPNLCVPHRRLVCFCRLFEVYDINKKERAGQHQREIFLFNDMLLVTKLSRKARTISPQQYTFRQSISLQGLYVQLFQSPHYNFGIRLCQRANDETLVMFNARNELDQNRFVEDLNESIAEMDEMDAIRTSNLIDALHQKFLERLRRHALAHTTAADATKTYRSVISPDVPDAMENDISSSSKPSGLIVGGDIELLTPRTKIEVASDQLRCPSKFSSMSNLASVAEVQDEDGLANHLEQQSQLKKSSADKQPKNSSNGQRRQQSMHRDNFKSQLVPHRSYSTSSIHSLDSGLFLSRDVSPNQSG